MTSPDQSTIHSNTLHILGVVLAGGQSSRMKADKATLCINDISNLDRSMKTLNDCDVSDVVVSGSHTHSNSQEKHITDRYPNGGPLSGIFSVLLSALLNTKELKEKQTALLVMPVDMPLLTPLLLNTLIAQGVANNTACCYQSFNLPIYLPVTSKLIDFLTSEFLSERFTRYNKGPSLKHLLKHIGCQFVEPLNVDVLANANTPKQWDAIVKLMN